MSLPKVASKSEDTPDDRSSAFNFTSSFDRARQLFQEIESILESELAGTPQIMANYDNNIARVKSKRKRGPFLIKPLNKNKSRRSFAIFSVSPSPQAQGDMEYDPLIGVWQGNDESLKPFSGHPALITNKGRHTKPAVIGRMTWDAKEGKWRGNDEDLRIFERPKIPLIANMGNDLKSIKHGDMTFNHVTMRWEGNDVDLLDFGDLGTVALKDDGFAVGTEFQLSPATTQLFIACADRHRQSTSGWWQDDKTRTHLHTIRTMSIVRIVRDVKRGSFTFYDEPADMDIAQEKEPASSSLPLRSPRAVAEPDFDDAWDDVGPFVGSAKLKLPAVESPVIDLDVDIDGETPKDDKKSNRNSAKREVEEDWDNDFDDDMDKFASKIGQQKAPGTEASGIAGATATVGNAGLVHPNVTNLSKVHAEKKPFALLKSDAPQRRSFILPTDSVKKPKQKGKGKEKAYLLVDCDIPPELVLLGYEASDEDDELGLEIPTSEPLRLKLPNRPPAAEDVVDVHEDLGEDASSPHEEPFEEPEEEELEEEDWNDVDVPAELGEPITKRPELLRNMTKEIVEKEEWEDMELPAEKLAQKISQQQQLRQQQQQQQQQQKSGKKKKDDDDAWSDVEIPDNFQLRLRK